MLNERRPLLEIKGLHLAFPLRMIAPSSMRDVFISTMLGPFAKDKKRSPFMALENIDLTIFEGDRVGLIGVNGAGKSTLCRCIAGLYSPHSGSLKKHGSVRALFEASLGLYPELSGRENARVLAEIYFPEYKNELEEIVEESLDFSGLEGFIDAPIKTYSKGMLVRLTLSLLSARPADILILDEVFDGADEFFREKLSTRVTKLINSSGAVLFVSHYEAHIQGVCNRAVVLGEGKVLHDGDIGRAYEIYRTL